MKQAHSQGSPITLLGKRNPDHLHVKKLRPCFLPSPQPDEVPSFEITATIFQVVRSTQAKLSYDPPSPTTTRPGSDQKIRATTGQKCHHMLASDSFIFSIFLFFKLFILHWGTAD